MAAPKPMQTIYMRHAEYNSDDGALSQNGINQATDIARQLVATDNAPKIILTSPELRAKQTADTIAKALVNKFGQNAPAITEITMLSDEAKTSGTAVLLGTSQGDLVVTHLPTLKRIEEAHNLTMNDPEDAMHRADFATAYVLQIHKGGSDSKITLISDIIKPQLPSAAP